MEVIDEVAVVNGAEVAAPIGRAVRMLPHDVGKVQCVGVKRLLP